MAKKSKEAVDDLKIKKETKSNGRPKIYTDDLAERICKIVATNPYGLPELCKMFPDIPSYETINVWRWEIDSFSDKYAKAKQFQAELIIEEIDDIAQQTKQYMYTDKEGASRIDSGVIAQARLVTDNRKWMASKLAPKIYGDQKQVERLETQNDALRAELQELRNKLDAQNRKEF